MGRRIPLVYLLAASHSGSTLLAMLLGAHPDLCTVGELKLTSLGDIQRYRCGCGELITACPFWNAVVARLRAEGVAFELGASSTDFASGASAVARRLLSPLHRSRPLEWIRDAALAMTPGWRAHLARTQASNAALAAAVLDLTGRRAIVDSSKIGTRLKFLLRHPRFDVKVVRLTRDGRAVSLTYMDPFGFADAKRPELRGGGHGDHRDAERLPMDRAAREWRRANEEAEAICRTLEPSQFVKIRYEDVCADPDATLARVFTFIGVEPLDRARLLASPQQRHVVGNGMRLDWDGSVKLDERWRGALDGSALEVFDRVAGTLNRRLGYDPWSDPDRMTPIQ
jgi:hypothetical protein